MSPFDETHWTDYVRGLLDGEKATAMEVYLAQAGAGERQAIGRLQAVAELGRREAQLEPPAGALRRAKALGSLLRPREEPSLVARILATLSFDSAAAPLAVGVRDLEASYRQVRWQAADFLVDMKVETELPARTTTVVGQLLRGQGAMEPASQIAILATAPERYLGQFKTDDLGEFHLEGLPVETRSLLFMVAEDFCVEVPLNSKENPPDASWLGVVSQDPAH